MIAGHWLTGQVAQYTNGLEGWQAQGLGSSRDEAGGWCVRVKRVGVGGWCVRVKRVGVGTGRPQLKAGRRAYPLPPQPIGCNLKFSGSLSLQLMSWGVILLRCCGKRIRDCLKTLSRPAAAALRTSGL